ncbi:MAG TPA: DUF4199 domain-containing protein [Paludibacter sp.]|nr:DUF4199 domain-containing protein [Paludibacter sp.]
MQPNITKSALYNFHFVGLLLSVKFILSAQKYSILASFAFFISILLIFILYRMSVHFRDNECNGTIKYGQAFSYIFLVYLFGSFVSSIVMVIYTSLIDTHYLTTTLDVLLKLYDSYNFPVDDKTYAVLKAIYKPVPFSLINIVSSMIGGAFWGLILAAFVKKEKNIFS